MSLEVLKDWIAILGLGGVVGTVAALIVKAILERKGEAFRLRLQEGHEARERREHTDRATYNQRLTVLIREHLAAFVRSGRWPSTEDDLRQLLLSLSRGAHEHFLDPEVNRAWETLVTKSLELAARRLTTEIGESDIVEYNRVHREWEDAAKRSFGPLPPTPEILPSRRAPRDFESDVDLSA